ncbi:pentapeptide repeat-containing protein [Methanococcoides methylutens]|uniref:Pentapeptide repeat family protein n=1 Tax=Methanococcoides methylutens MM1 TaxID=1434104 RepID=A0A0E3SSC4_METMT|nr:pentapeptide repeat-containing protein [Methanococcoides methylutens]AKB85403.1 hypothetical protein MCMEM_1350 [Methanococcoides methylutens MM1]
MFSKKDQKSKVIKNVIFKKANLNEIIFDNAILINCNFDKANLNHTSFLNCKLINCRFREAIISWCNFKYSKISGTTFESSNIEYCDFYRALFSGVNIFINCSISNTGLPDIRDGATIGKSNLKNHKILQQNEELYRTFLEEWYRRRPEGTEWDWEASLNKRFSDAKVIFELLSGFWLSKGHIGDSNWAYLQAKKMEREQLKNELKLKGKNAPSFYHKIKNIYSLFSNYSIDFICGYGESLYKTMGTFISITILFAIFYYILLTYIYSIELPDTYLYNPIMISLKNMVAMSTEEVTNMFLGFDIIMIIQRIFGILLIAIFGFILGNKVRHQ